MTHPPTADGALGRSSAQPSPAQLSSAVGGRVPPTADSALGRSSAQLSPAQLSSAGGGRVALSDTAERLFLIGPPPAGASSTNDGGAAGEPGRRPAVGAGSDAVLVPPASGTDRGPTAPARNDSPDRARRSMHQLADQSDGIIRGCLRLRTGHAPVAATRLSAAQHMFFSERHSAHTARRTPPQGFQRYLLVNNSAAWDRAGLRRSISGTQGGTA